MVVDNFAGTPSLKMGVPALHASGFRERLVVVLGDRCPFALQKLDRTCRCSDHVIVAKGHQIKVGRFPYQANGKAIALGETEGFVKTVFDAQTGELLGAHMIGTEVTELIQGFSIAKTLETTEAELIESIFPHPTLSETMHEAVLDAYGRALHI